MTLTPSRRRDYALVPATRVGAVAMLTVLFGMRYLRPPIHLAPWLKFPVVIGTFLMVSAGVYSWRVWRRNRNATAYGVRAASAWSLEEDWRHQLGLWAVGLILGGLALICLRVISGFGWLRS